MADGLQAARIAVELLDVNGDPVPQRNVTFTTTLGDLSVQSAFTDVAGIACGPEVDHRG